MFSIAKIKELLLDILFPPICLNCNTYLKKEEKDSALCGSCLAKIQVHNTFFCSVCRARLPENKKVCHKNSSYLLGAAVNYNESVKSLVHGFKYKYWTRLKKPISG